MAIIDKISNEVWFNSKDLYALTQKQDDNFHEMYGQELKKLFMDGIGHSMYTAFHFYWHPSEPHHYNRFEIKCMSYNEFCEWTDEKRKKKEEIIIEFLKSKGFIINWNSHIIYDPEDLSLLRIVTYKQKDILKNVETAEKYFGSIKEHKEKVLRLFNEKGE